MKNKKLGWIPDLPDHRDFPSEVFNVVQLDASGNPEQTPVPTMVDLRGGFSPVEDQGQLGSCTANAGIALVEYMERKYGKGAYVDGSRLFLYKNSRKLAGFTGDSGAYLRDTIKALRLFGVPPESSWPYDITKFDVEPDAFNYAYAQNFKSLRYFRVDMPGYDNEKILGEIKSKVSKGIPLMFGTSVYNGIFRSVGDIPFPNPTEQCVGGHAMVICGFDDARSCIGTTRPGAFLIRNSWGPNWGQSGYGWLPYEYLYAGLMCDIWGILKQDWVNPAQFQ